MIAKDLPGKNTATVKKEKKKKQRSEVTYTVRKSGSVAKDTAVMGPRWRSWYLSTHAACSLASSPHSDHVKCGRSVIPG